MLEPFEKEMIISVKEINKSIIEPAEPGLQCGRCMGEAVRNLGPLSKGLWATFQPPRCRRSGWELPCCGLRGNSLLCYLDFSLGGNSIWIPAWCLHNISCTNPSCLLSFLLFPPLPVFFFFCLFAISWATPTAYGDSCDI